MSERDELSGLELREAVATRVMGLHGPFVGWISSAGGYVTSDADKLRAEDLLDATLREVPHYESDISAAFAVMEKMRERGFVFCYLSSVPDGAAYRFKTSFAHMTPLGRKSPTNHDAIAATAPMAICLAAIRAARSAGKGE